MINITKELINWKGENLRNFLIDLSVFNVFEKMFEEEWVDNPTFEALVKYITSIYSVDSDYVLLGADWLKLKQTHFNKNELPEEFYEQVVLLKSKNITLSIKEWLDYQNNDTHAQLCMLKDLRVEMQISAVSAIKKGTNAIEIDYDQKFRNAKYSQDLLVMIRETEQALLQNDPKMKDGHQEVKRALKNHSLFASPEIFSK